MRRCSFFLFLFYSWAAAAASVNRTIDDTYGDSVTGAKPSYLPTTSSVWQGPDCSGCWIQPDPNQAFDRTWTAATYNPGLGSMSIELSFTGTAIYIYFILANYVAEGITTETACAFTLDGASAGSFEHTPSSSTDMQYNALVFSQKNLANTAHTLKIVTSGITDRNIFVNFDYAIYTFEDTPTPSTSTSSHTTSTSSSTTSSSTTSSLTGSPSTSPSTTLSPTGPSSNSTSTTTSSSNPASSTLLSGSSPGLSTSPTPSTSSTTQTETSKPKPIGAIVGGIIGGVAAILIIGLLFLFCRRRRNHLSEEHYPVMEAFRNPSTTNSAADSTNTSGGQVRNTHATFLQSGLVSPYSGDGADIVLAPQRYGNHNFNASISEMPSSINLAPSNSAYSPPASETSSLPYAIPRVDVPPMETGKGRTRVREKMERHMAHEMSNLSTQPAPPPGGHQDANEIERMRDQMRVMRDRLELLTHQQQSEALVLLDEPPPDYASAHP